MCVYWGVDVYSDVDVGVDVIGYVDVDMNVDVDKKNIKKQTQKNGGGRLVILC